MTGTNCTLDAARNGLEKPRPLLRKERLAGGNLFFRLTTHANGCPVYLSVRGDTQSPPSSSGIPSPLVLYFPRQTKPAIITAAKEHKERTEKDLADQV
jgi:hypothetical protein